MKLLYQTSFFRTINNYLQNLPSECLAEVAFIGRSNSGKSSAINTLCNQKNLAFTSKKPGSTKYINYFIVGSQKSPKGFIVDLPGYGYTKLYYTSHTHWNLLTEYLLKRSINGVILLTDSRHPITNLDLEIFHLIMSIGLPVHFLLTKADKLSKKESTQALQILSTKIPLYNNTNNQLSAQLFSSLKHIGLKETYNILARWLKL